MTTARDLIRRFEGLRLKAYQDKTGKWTCGYGETGPDIGPDTVFTQGQAEARLLNRLCALQLDIRKLLKTAVSGEQFAAISSLTWNIGLENFGGSTLLQKLNDGDVPGAAEEFKRWRFEHVNGVAVEDPILVHRRFYERLVFLGDEDPTPAFGTPNPLVPPKES